VFATPEGLFEPTVMFFGLTNSSAIFKTMMNNILQNLINTREVVSFIDNVIVGTKEKEGHNEVVEEVVKRLAENCCGNYLSQGQIISQAVNFSSGISSGKFTRELDKESLLN